MRLFHDWSIKTKLILFSTVSGVLALGLACSAFVVNDLHLMRAAKVRQLQSQAEILGFGKSAGMSLNDASAREEFLMYLRQQPSIERACLYSSKGRALAAFPKSALSEFPAHIALIEGQRFTSKGTLELLHPVIEGGKMVGGVFLQASTSDIELEFNDCLRIAWAVLLSSIAISFALSYVMQRSLARPILTLARTARNIERDADYSVRIPPTTRDEIGTLYEAFNLMLDKIETSNSALEQAHDRLEQRVEERTSQLQVEINERERIQQELVRAKDAAEAASQAKSEFLANMSHEIRTPLNAILGFTRLMRDGVEPEAERLDFLDTIHSSGQHLVTLINDILDLSKIEAGQLDYEFTRWSPHQVIAEVISVLRVRAKEKGLSLEYHWASKIPDTISTDPGRLRQLLLNVVGNAIKFTEHGGVRLVARLVPEAEELTIDVIDTGIGIPKDKQQLIFEPFCKVDSSMTRQFGGTGLGLSICRHIANGLHGRLSVESELGHGSSFSVVISTGDLTGIRMLNEPDADILYRNQCDQPIRHRKLPKARILAVDDGDTNRKLIKLVLSRAGVEIDTAEDGQQALAMALNEKFDLILMDMQMPIVDGYSATRRLREEGVTIPIIALTAHAMRDDEARCLEAGCSGYLTKPIDPDRLIDALASELHGQSQTTFRTAPSESTAQRAPLICTLPLDDAEFLDIVHEFVIRLRDRVTQMQEAHAGCDLERLGQLAHWLKGSGGTAGFTPLSEAARVLEQALESVDQTAIGKALAAIADLTERIELPELVALR